VLLHGAGNDMLSWDDGLCRRLAAGGRRVVRLDFRDAGRSVTYPVGEPPYGLRDLVADLIGVLDALELPAADVVGMSMGGSVGQLAAIEHPGRVASLTLVGCTPGVPGGEGEGLPGIDDRLREFFAHEPATPDWSDRAAAVDYLVEAHRPFAARSRPFDEARMRELQGRVFDRAADIVATVTNPYRMDAGEPWRARLGGIAAPTLVSHGEEDPMFPLAHGRALAEEIPGARLLPLAQTGHEYLPPHTWDTVVPAILLMSR
jgi:pimeloyl-ACP methyl ester carboxylesterase